MSVIDEISSSKKIRNLIKANFNEVADLDINHETKEITFHNPIEKIKPEVNLYKNYLNFFFKI